MTRREIMQRIQGDNLKPERLVRQAARRAKASFASNCKTLPGKPDLAFMSIRLAVFVDGCFWHGHKCSKLPKTRRRFWREKIAGNRRRDARNRRKLRKLGWRTMTIRECRLQGGIQRMLKAVEVFSFT